MIGESDADAAAAFADDLAPDWPELQGVVGALRRPRRSRERWMELTGRGAPAARSAAPARAAPSTTCPRRRARRGVATDRRYGLADRAAVARSSRKWACPIRPRARAKYLPLRVARGDFRIWDDGGRVAYAGFNDAAPDFARIAPVYTLPECRGRGYATALVAALSRELLARGKRKPVPHDRRRESDVERDLRADRLSRRERRLPPRFHRAGEG